MKRFLRFFMTGLVNTGIDIGVLGLLTAYIGLGWSILAFPIFKAASFSLSAANSYIMNRYWVFRGSRVDSTAKNVSAFLAVSLIGLGMNALVSWSAFAVIAHMPFRLETVLAAGLAAAAGSAAVLAFNFIGYKSFVFKPRYKVAVASYE